MYSTRSRLHGITEKKCKQTVTVKLLAVVHSFLLQLSLAVSFPRESMHHFHD